MATTTSQPIALRPSSTAQDYTMQDANGSFSGSSSRPFNPASYTRQFIGSPISWRGGSYGMGSLSSSWGSRIPVGSPTHRLLSSWEAGKTPSSLEGDRDSILNALNVFDREGEFCRNYTCCGMHLEDLHALLEHFEEVHIIVLDRDASNPQAHIQVPFNPQVNESTPQQQAQIRQRRQQQQQLFGQPHQPAPPSSFDPDDMELELDLDNTTSMPQTSPPCPPASTAQSSASSHSSPSSGAPSPPDTPISTPLSAYPSPHAFVPSHLPSYMSQPSSPLSGTAASTRQSSPTGTSSSNANSTLRPNLNLNLSYHPRSHLSSPSILAHPEDAFNTYARFSSDYSSGLPGAQYNGASVDEASALTWQQVQALQQVQQQGQQQQTQQAQMQQQMNGCLPPALLFAPSASCTPAGTPGGSRVPSPTPQSQPQQATTNANPNASPPSAASPLNKVHNAPAQTSPPRAAGASANANNVNSHQHSAHSTGSNATSNSQAPANILRPASSLLLSKPFRCPKPNCNKSYKQANGLKYHMTHGSCNFAPPKDLEHVKDLLERKRRERDAQALANGTTPLNRSVSLGGNSGADGGSSTGNQNHNPAHIGGLPTTLDTALLNSYYDLNLQSMNITETELREVEREAEKRLRPFACGVGDCQRRYKNMNGLRYHYQHSGEHGAVGLALLASGQHECLQNNHSGKRREQSHQHAASSSNSTNTNHHQNAATSSNYTSTNATNTTSNTNSNAGYSTTTFAMDEDREGRKRFGGSSAFSNKGAASSQSVPVSRAGSLSRTGTPAPVTVPVSANTSPKTSPRQNAMATTPMGGSSSLSGALGGVQMGGGTSAMTTPIQVVPVRVQQVNGVGINTGLSPLPSGVSVAAAAAAASPPPPGSASSTAGSPSAGSPQAQVTQAQMQQMAAAAYQQYAQQFQRQYQAAMQMHAVQQQGQQAAAAQQQGSPSANAKGSASPQQQGQQQQYGYAQGGGQDWMSGVGMAMDMS
ncbi:hypothetical protein DFP72DRAFT_1168833 [Ephemerocybe angulata]|uniref:C2H2-type domain-containing protein n=2 Tax=Ephemerocybe angulata TaxID=980116 RepID=A0A8H6M8B4_9AGAR|nr:hypothetical protein DFP72DRAFT_1168833 [Tulosesus angulatus]